MLSDTLDFTRYGPPENHQGDREVAHDFFEAFSRFEYALKFDDLFVGGKKAAQADWNRFVKLIEDSFDSESSKEDLKSAVRYILDDPPLKQVVEATSGKVAWGPPPDEGGSELMRLIHHIKDMRNNLFHDGKSDPDSLPQLERNTFLLRCGMTVLAECLRICETKRPSFFKIYKGENH